MKHAFITLFLIGLLGVAGLLVAQSNNDPAADVDADLLDLPRPVQVAVNAARNGMGTRLDDPAHQELYEAIVQADQEKYEAQRAAQYEQRPGLDEAEQEGYCKLTLKVRQGPVSALEMERWYHLRARARDHQRRVAMFQWLGTEFLLTKPQHKANKLLREIAAAFADQEPACPQRERAFAAASERDAELVCTQFILAPDSVEQRGDDTVITLLAYRSVVDFETVETARDFGGTLERWSWDGDRLRFLSIVKFKPWSAYFVHPLRRGTKEAAEFDQMVRDALQKAAANAVKKEWTDDDGNVMVREFDGP